MQNHSQLAAEIDAAKLAVVAADQEEAEVLETGAVVGLVDLEILEAVEVLAVDAAAGWDGSSSCTGRDEDVVVDVVVGDAVKVLVKWAARDLAIQDEAAVLVDDREVQEDLVDEIPAAHSDVMDAVAAGQDVVVDDASEAVHRSSFEAEAVAVHPSVAAAECWPDWDLFPRSMQGTQDCDVTFVGRRNTRALCPSVDTRRCTVLDEYFRPKSTSRRRKND